MIFYLINLSLLKVKNNAFQNIFFLPFTKPKPLIQLFLLVQKEGWYRIPKMERTPKMVVDGSIKYLAFYHTSKFKKEKYSIRFYAKVLNIRIVSRKDLFPNEPRNHPKAGKIYYKIQIDQLLPLVKPIISHRPRRITFIPTSEEKFFHSSLWAFFSWST